MWLPPAAPRVSRPAPPARGGGGWRRGLAAGLCLAPWILGVAQGTKADYDRAARLAETTRDRVFRDRVTPHWLPGGTRFWYRVRTGPEQSEYVLVDAGAGTRRVAFDTERLSAALRAAGVETPKPGDLNLESVEFDGPGPGLRFRFGGKSWHWHDGEGALRPRLDAAGPAEPARRGPLPRSSRSTGAETRVTFVNRTGVELELVWLNTEGERQSYGRIAAGETRSQHTYAGHAWLLVDAQGRARVWTVATEDALSVEISEADLAETVAEPARPPGRGGRRRGEGTSPDGRWQAFLRENNLWVRELPGAAEHPLSDDGTAAAAYREPFLWSPDSRYLVATRRQGVEERQVSLIESSPKDQVQPRLHTFGYAKPGDPLPVDEPRMFELAGRRRVPTDNALFDRPWSISDGSWAPDSREFRFLYNARGHQLLRWVAVDAATGTGRAVVEERSPTFIDYAHKQFSHFLDRTQELIWMSERDGWNHLYLYDTATGRVKNPITQGAWVVRGVEHVDADRRQVWFRAGGIRPGQDPYHVHYARVNLDGSGLVVLTEGDGTHHVTFSPDRQFLVDTWSRVDHPPVTELRRASDGARVCGLEQADWRALQAVGWRPPERLVAKGRDGVTDIYGVLHRPMRLEPRRRYPVIEQIYAGPQSAYVPKAFQPFHKAQALAELGFIVVQVDGMGTSHRSKAFHDVACRNLVDAGFPDRVRWIRAAAAVHPEMDLGRVGIYGGSAGGQNALGGLLTHGDFYKVGVADCGCHDNRMDKIWWNELWMGWPVGPHYAEQSNVTLAHRLQGKLLLIVGELDRNVDPASTLQVVNALVKADKDFELLVLPGTGHGAAETPYGNRRRMDFFVRHLWGVEPRR